MDIDPKILLLAMAGDRRQQALMTLSVAEQQMKELILETMLDHQHGVLMAIAQIERDEYTEFFHQ